MNRILALTKGAASVETRANIVGGVLPDWMDKTVIARWPNGTVGEYRVRGGHIQTRQIGPIEFTLRVELAAEDGVTPEEVRNRVAKKIMDALVTTDPGAMGGGVWAVRAQVEDKGFRG